jgi:hypothetical protein
MIRVNIDRDYYCSFAPTSYDMHTSGEFPQAPAVLSGVAKGSASEQSKLVRGELATVLVHRSRRAQLNVVTKAKRSRFQKPVSVTFFREEWGRNVWKHSIPLYAETLLQESRLEGASFHDVIVMHNAELCGPNLRDREHVPSMRLQTTSSILPRLHLLGKLQDHICFGACGCRSVHKATGREGRRLSKYEVSLH